MIKSCSSNTTFTCVEFSSISSSASQRPPASRVVPGVPVPELQPHLPEVPEGLEVPPSGEPGRTQPVPMAPGLLRGHRAKKLKQPL